MLYSFDLNDEEKMIIYSLGALDGNPLRSIDKAGKILDSYAQAMKVIYKDKPKQMQALFDYHKLLRCISQI